MVAQDTLYAIYRKQQDKCGSGNNVLKSYMLPTQNLLIVPRALRERERIAG